MYLSDTDHFGPAETFLHVSTHDSATQKHVLPVVVIQIKSEQNYATP